MVVISTEAKRNGDLSLRKHSPLVNKSQTIAGDFSTSLRYARNDSINK